MRLKARWAVYCAFVLALCLFVEGFSYAALLVLRRRGIGYHPNPSRLTEEQKRLIGNIVKQGTGSRTGLDPDLGWVPVRETNSAGMRDNREYTLFPGPGTVRIAAYGDSFTFGADVALTESWAKQLAAAAPRLEVLNYGMGAYGLDQAYLRYHREATRYHPNVVFIGYMSENIARDVNVYRIFYAPMYANNVVAKPRFRVKDDRLVLVKNPLPTIEDYAHLLRDDKKMLVQLGSNDYHYQINYNSGHFDFLASVRFAKMLCGEVNGTLLHPIFRRDGMYQVNSEAYDVTVHIFDAFYREVLKNGALPIIVVFPDSGDQARSRLGKERRYAPLLQNFRAKGYRFMDLLDAIQPYESQYTIDQLTRAFGHFSPVGNQIIAMYLLKLLSVLRKRSFLSLSPV